MNFGGDGVTAEYVNAAIAAHDGDENAHPELQQMITEAVEDLREEIEEGLVEAGKVNDVTVNGDTVLDPNTKVANITVPVKISDLPNDSQYQTESQVNAKVAAAAVNEVNVSVDNTAPSGQPSAEKTFQGGVLNITFKNVKGEKGEQGEQGIQGRQGVPGESAVFDPETGNISTLVHETGDSIVNPMSQKGVTDTIKDLSTTQNEVIAVGGLLFDSEPIIFESVKTGARLRGDGQITNDASYDLIKYNVTNLTAVVVDVEKVSTYVMQFQSSSTFDIGNLVGSVYSDSVRGIVMVPEGATHLVVCVTNESRPENVHYLKQQDNAPTAGSKNVVSSGNLAKESIDKVRTLNLINENDIVLNKYINNSGDIKTSSGWAISHPIPVVAGNKYYISIFGTVGKETGYLFQDASGNKVSYGSGYFTGAHTAPEGASFLIVNMASGGVRNTKVVCLEETQPQSYLPYYQVAKESVQNVLPDYDTTPQHGSQNLVNSGAVYDFVTAQKARENGIFIKKQGNELTVSNEPVNDENLFNEDDIIPDMYIKNNNVIVGASGWALSGYIPVIAGKQYSIAGTDIARTTGINFCDAEKTTIQGGGTTQIYKTHTAPEGAAYMIFNIGQNGSLTQNVEVREVSNSATVFNAVLEASNNPVFNYKNITMRGAYYGIGDDVAPMHILGTTIGANHGMTCTKATITSHGLANEDIGTEWIDGSSRKFYVVAIPDEDNVMFKSENVGTMEAPSFVNLATGTLTKGNTTLDVEAVDSSQIWPMVANHIIRLMLDGKEELSEDGQFSGEYLDIVESYDIKNPASVLENLIDNAGQDVEPTYEGDLVVTVKNTYRFVGNMNVLVIATIIPKQRVSLDDIMFAQAVKIGSAKYYIPNSLPYTIGGQTYDFSKPLTVTWNLSSSVMTNEAHSADGETPINRVLQYDAVGGVGESIGYVDVGIGKSLFDTTARTFELRNNTGKIYPHGVESSKVGNYLEVGQIYNAVLYKSFFALDSTTNRLSMYHFPLGNAEYVFLDYSGSMIDDVVVDSRLNGKEIEVVESSGVTLMTDVYNDGLIVNAQYVNGNCYIVLKIK